MTEYQTDVLRPRAESCDETDDEPTRIDVKLPPLRDSPNYVYAYRVAYDAPYAGDSETEETVYLVGPNGEINPSDELVAAVEAVLAKIYVYDGRDECATEDIETDLENALERYRGRA